MHPIFNLPTGKLLGRRHLDDFYRYVARNLDDSSSQEQQDEVMDDFDPYYAYDDGIKQHPWYSHTMLIVLAVLLLIVFGYAAFQLYFRSKECKDDCDRASAVCSVQDEHEEVPGDYDITTPQVQMTGMDTSSRRHANNNHYVNMTDDGKVPVTRGVPA